MTLSSVVSIGSIQAKIFVIRGEKVLLDRDLAELYGVDTRQLTRQVRRNLSRFPEDFAFSLTKEELHGLRIATATAGWGGLRYRPWVFTEQGVAMLSSVLRSPQAIEANVQIMRAFVQFRTLLSTQDHFRRRLADLEHRLTEHDEHFKAVFDAIRQLMKPVPADSRKKIGFQHHRNGE
jgi:hypothetical protein